MSLQEWAVAIGLLTPLVLGILAFIEKFIHRKGDSDKEVPEVVQGMTVTTDSYADRLIIELTRERDEADAAAAKATQDNEVLRAQLNAYKERNNN